MDHLVLEDCQDLPVTFVGVVRDITKVLCLVFCVYFFNTVETSEKSSCEDYSLTVL